MLVGGIDHSEIRSPRGLVSFRDCCGGKEIREEGISPSEDWIPVRFREKRTAICRLSLDIQVDPRHNPARKIGFVCLPPCL